MDAAGTVDVAAYLRRPEADHSYGYGAVCVPGLPAGLWRAHQQWGTRTWAQDVAPAIALAQEGFRVLPKSRDLFEEQTAKLHRGDAEIARVFLTSDGQLPTSGNLLPNPDLARTLEFLSRHGRDGFYRGPVAEAIVGAAQRGGGSLTAGDLAGYEPRLTTTIGINFRDYRIESAPPPANGAAMLLPALKALEDEPFEGTSLRTAANLDRLGRVWSVVEPEAYRLIGDTPDSRNKLERLLSVASIRAIRQRALAPTSVPVLPAAAVLDASFSDNPMAATTHFIVVDLHGDVVCATQSLGVHFGAGVVPPGTGVVLNNSMSNFEYRDPKNPNYLAPGHRPRSTIAPTLVLLRGQPVLALGVPGAARIPTALLQVLLDHLVFHRRLGEAIGDTRFHYMIPWKKGDVETFEAEQSFPAAQAEALQARGWKIDLSEPAGRGRHFGGVNAVEIAPDGTLTGYADPRRTNTAAGY
jgi:gamma-glutamyltranspeptidase/glutathione hydrolase